MRYLVVALMVAISVSSCQVAQETEKQEPAQSPPTEEIDVNALGLRSTAFAEGENIPEVYTCDGKDVSPPLSWSKSPEGTRSLALICDDPDAPMGTWVHWVMYRIAPDVESLPGGVPKNEEVLEGARHGTTSFKRVGYGGPCPPKGNPHRYFFKLYALDAELELEAGRTKADLQEAMEGHIIAQGQLMGKYERQQ
jgi:Raf kinase inhibitor-like YbhB/YbcL family protein